MMRIDAHHHFWTIGRYGMPWLAGDALKPIIKTFAPDDLRPHLQSQRIDKTILVQTISSVDETRWFCQLSEQHDFIAGVVGWVGLTSRDVGSRLDELTQSPRLVGIRHQVHDEPDGNWLLRDDVRAGLRALEARGLVYDLLIKPPHLDAAAKVAASMPSLKFVVDHIAKPRIAEQGWDDWAGPISALASHENVSCKLSGMITEAHWDRWTPADLKPYIDHVINAFGVERVLFGSDWPVCNLAGGYDDVVEALRRNIAELSPGEQRKIFGENAARIYGIKP
jgi:L-fuconolactonase